MLSIAIYKMSLSLLARTMFNLFQNTDEGFLSEEF